MAFVGNGCSLEDCHTNIFALTELTGICWRRYHSEAAYSIVNNQNVLKNPLDNSVLSSYANLAQRNVLCAWRRAAKAAEAGIVRSSASAAQPDTTITTELWLFWYEDAEKQATSQALSGSSVMPTYIQECIAPELRDSDCGSWEFGMSYEVRTMLFRALHNATERSLARDYVRLGRWFVQPTVSTSTVAASSRRKSDSAQFAIAFNFFLHGESTVCVACDVRVASGHFRRVTLSDFAVASHVHTVFRPSAADTAQDNSAPHSQSRSIACVLAPFGIVAHLTGAAFKRQNDAELRRITECWQRLLPLQFTPSDSDVSGLPEFAEVTVGGRRMCYPTAFVLIAGDEVPCGAFADANGCAVDPSMRLVDVGATALVRHALRLGRRSRPRRRAKQLSATDHIVKREPGTESEPSQLTSDTPFPLASVVRRTERANCACSLVKRPLRADAEPADDSAAACLTSNATPFHKRRRRANDAATVSTALETDATASEWTPDADNTPRAVEHVHTRLNRQRDRVVPVRCVANATQCGLDALADPDEPLVVAPFGSDADELDCSLESNRFAHGDEMHAVGVRNDVAVQLGLPRLPVGYLDAANEHARDCLDDDDQLILRDVLLGAASRLLQDENLNPDGPQPAPTTQSLPTLVNGPSNSNSNTVPVASATRTVPHGRPVPQSVTSAAADMLLSVNPSFGVGTSRAPNAQDLDHLLSEDDDEDDAERRQARTPHSALSFSGSLGAPAAQFSMALPSVLQGQLGAGAKLAPNVTSPASVGGGTSISSSSGSGFAPDQLARMFPTPPSLETHLIPSPSDIGALSSHDDAGAQPNCAAIAASSFTQLNVPVAALGAQPRPWPGAPVLNGFASANTQSNTDSSCPSGTLRRDTLDSTGALTRRNDAAMQTDLARMARRRRRQDRSLAAVADCRWTVYQLPLHASSLTFGKFAPLCSCGRDYRLSVPTPAAVTYQPPPGAGAFCPTTAPGYRAPFASGPGSACTPLPSNAASRSAYSRDGLLASASVQSIMTPATSSTSFSDASPSPFAARTPSAVTKPPLSTSWNGPQFVVQSNMANNNCVWQGQGQPHSIGVLQPSSAGPGPGPAQPLSVTGCGEAPLPGRLVKFGALEPLSECSACMPLSLHSLVLNVALYDSVLNLFADRNFDACTICACNMNAKGNSAELELYLAAQPELDSDEAPAGSFACLCAFSPVANRHRSLRNCGALFSEDAVEPPPGSPSTFRSAWHSLLDVAEFDTITATHPHAQPATTVGGSGYVHHLLYSACVPFSLRLLLTQLSGAFASSFTAAWRAMRDDRTCLRVELTKRTRSSRSSRLFNLEQYDACRFARSLANTVLNASYASLSVEQLPVSGTPLSGLLAESNDQMLSRQSLITLPLATTTSRTAQLDPCTAHDDANKAHDSDVKPRRGKRNAANQNVPAVLTKSEPSIKLEQVDDESPIDGTLHSWLFESPVRPDNTHAVLACLRSLRPYLLDAVSVSRYSVPTRSDKQRHGDTLDTPKKVAALRTDAAVANGPLSWAEFHKLSGSAHARASTGAEQHDAQPGPQPIPPLLVTSSELRDWITTSPFSVRHWEQLHLQPYTQLTKDVLYLILTPPPPANARGTGTGTGGKESGEAAEFDLDDDLVQHSVNAYLDELNQVYELCRFGKHQPFVLGLPNANRHGFVAASSDDHAVPTPTTAEQQLENDAARSAFLRFVEAYLNTVQPVQLRSLLLAYARTLQTVAEYLTDVRNLPLVERAFNESLQVPLSPGYAAARPTTTNSDGMPLGLDGRPLFKQPDLPEKPAQTSDSAVQKPANSLFDHLLDPSNDPNANVNVNANANSGTSGGCGTQPSYPAFPTVSPDGLVHIPALVIYLVDPFAAGTSLDAARRNRYLIGLMHVAQYALTYLRSVCAAPAAQLSGVTTNLHGRTVPTGFANVLTELLKADNVYFEVLSVEHLLNGDELAPASCEERWRNEARRAAFSLYARIATGINQVPSSMNQSRSLTGFGPASARENSLKLLVQRFDRSLADGLLKDRFSVYSFRCTPDAYTVRLPSVDNAGLGLNFGAATSNANRYAELCVGRPDAAMCSSCPLYNALPLVRVYTPPFVLGTERAFQPPSNDPETSLAALTDEQSVVLHCFYSVTFDNQFVLASVTDQFGELLEVQVLNVGERCVVDQERNSQSATETAARRRSKNARGAAAVSVRRFALQRLWEFLLGIATQYARPVRFTIAKLGRVGHSELRGWVSILSRRNLQRASQFLRDSCASCQLQLNAASATGTQPTINSMGTPHSESTLSAPCVLSACLVALELDQCVRVLADSVRLPDEYNVQSRPSAICPLSSPPDASCTHILTLPVSATAQPHAVNAQDGFGGADAIPGVTGNAADEYNLLLGMGVGDMDGMAFPADIGEMGDFAELFGNLTNMNIPGLSGPLTSNLSTTQTGSANHPTGSGLTLNLGGASGQHHAVGSALLSPSVNTPLSGHAGVPHTPTLLTPGAFAHRASTGAPLGLDAANDAQADEHSAQCLQQPLSVGYYVSTAPTGPLPRAFRRAALNQHQQTPVCFRASLHVHTANGAHSATAAYDDPYYLSGLPQAHGGAQTAGTGPATSRAHPLDSALTCDVLRYVLESYNMLSWLTIDPVRSDRRCCLPLTYLSLVNLLELFDDETDADA